MDPAERFEALLASGKDNALLRFSLGHALPRRRARRRARRGTCARRRSRIPTTPLRGSCSARRSPKPASPQAATRSVPERHRGGRTARATSRRRKEMAVFLRRLEKATARRLGRARNARSSRAGVSFTTAARPRRVEQDQRDAARPRSSCRAPCTRATCRRGNRGASPASPKRREQRHQPLAPRFGRCGPAAPRAARRAPCPRRPPRRAARCRSPRPTRSRGRRCGRS